MEQLIGEKLGDRTATGLPNRYQVKSLLGKQTGRRTFLAEDIETKTPVVIKLVLFGPGFTWEELKLFEREAETLKSLDHPAIPKYLDSFEVKTPLGRGYALVQTYIEAKPLSEWVASGRKFGEPELQPMARSLLSILYYLHNCYPAVIHRDIKPSNILLSKATDEAPAKLYLIDFGSVQTAQMDSTLTVVGTYGYMPPEQFGGRAKPASDLYSLGATLIYLATGKHPAEITQDDLRLEFAHLVNFSASFTEWLSRLTQADLSQRTASASQALQQLTQSQSLTPASSSAHGTSSKSAVQHKFELKDFQILSTADTFEMQCLRSRIKQPLRVKTSMKELIRSGHEKETERKWVFLAAISLVSLFKIGTTVQTAVNRNTISSSDSWMIVHLLYVILIAALLASFAWFWYPHPKHDKSKKVTLKLARQRDRTILLTLSNLIESKGNTTQSPSARIFSEVPLDQLYVVNSMFSTSSTLEVRTLPTFHFGITQRKNLFFLKNSASQPEAQNRGKTGDIKHQRFCLTGTHAQIRWLAEQITQWRYDGIE